MRSKLMWFGLASLAVVIASCGSGNPSDNDASATSEEVFPGRPQLVVANSPGSLTTSGQQRIMTALVGGEANSFLGGDDHPITIRFELVRGEDDGGESGDGATSAEWLTTNASDLGLYVSRFSFDAAGTWRLTASDGSRELASTQFEITVESAVPQPGDPAPLSVTPTAFTAAEIAEVSTDTDPDPSFYELTVAEAVQNGRSTMIIFSTPAFCTTALCGPTMDFAKLAIEGQEDLDVVHVEPFDLELAPTGVLEPIEAMSDFGVATEPWIFLVDADGVVTHSFEGIIGQRELEDALES